MESSAIAVLVPLPASVGGIMAETIAAQASVGKQNLFSRMLAGVPVTSLPGFYPDMAGIAVPQGAILSGTTVLAEGDSQPMQSFAGKDVRSFTPGSVESAILMAFLGNPVENGAVPVPVDGAIPADAGIAEAETVVTGDMPALHTALSRRKAAATAEDAPESTESAPDTAGLLLSAAMQLLQSLQTSVGQQSPASAVPRQPAAASVVVQAVPEAPPGAESPEISQPATAPGIPSGTVIPVASAERNVPVTSHNDGLARESEMSGKLQKPLLKSGEEAASRRKGEVPDKTGGQKFDRALLEVVVEDALPEKPAEVVTPSSSVGDQEYASAARFSHSIIGGNPVLNTVDQEVSTATGQIVRSPEHSEILAQVTEQLGRAEFRANDGRVVLKLHPEELGSLRIDVKLDDQRLKLHIIADNPTVREALVTNLDSLKDSLSKQQIVVERFDVATGHGQTQHQLFRDQRQQVQYGDFPRSRRQDTGYDPGDDTVNLQSLASGWGDHDGSLLNVRF